MLRVNQQHTCCITSFIVHKLIVISDYYSIYISIKIYVKSDLCYYNLNPVIQYYIKKNIWKKLGGAHARRAPSKSALAWWHMSGSTLARVIACCWTTPSYYLCQCWLTINVILYWYDYIIYIDLNTQDINPQVEFEIYTLDVTALFPMGNELTYVSATKLQCHQCNMDMN